MSYNLSEELLASKSKQARLNAQLRGSLLRRRLFSILVMIGTVGLIATAVIFDDSNRNSKIARMNVANLAGSRFVTELDLIMAGKGEWSRLTPENRQMLQQMHDLNAADQLLYEVVGEDLDKYSVMGSNTMKEKRIINVYGPRFLRLASQHDPETFRSTFVAALLHEFEHLRKWPEMPHVVTSDELLEEEVHTYAWTSLHVIRPMRQAGLSVIGSYIQLDEILKSCGDDPNCPAFRKAVGNYIQ